jgi:hypothetical protein
MSGHACPVRRQRAFGQETPATIGNEASRAIRLGRRHVEGRGRLSSGPPVRRLVRRPISGGGHVQRHARPPGPIVTSALSPVDAASVAGRVAYRVARGRTRCRGRAGPAIPNGGFAGHACLHPPAWCHESLAGDPTGDEGRQGGGPVPAVRWSGLVPDNGTGRPTWPTRPCGDPQARVSTGWSRARVPGPRRGWGDRPRRPVPSLGSRVPAPSRGRPKAIPVEIDSPRRGRVLGYANRPSGLLAGSRYPGKCHPLRLDVRQTGVRSIPVGGRPARRTAGGRHRRGVNPRLAR